MADRTAIETIRGFLYQFDYTIYSLLKFVNGVDSIVVEGVEDVDLQTATESTAIQCKYYEKTEYNHSVIAEPIRLMLNHFKEVKSGKQTELKYKLRGYYKSGQSKLELPLTLRSLKDNFLTYTRTEKSGDTTAKVKHLHHVELDLDDSDLTKFISLLDIDINAKEFEQQYVEIIQLLRTEFKCSEFTAVNFYYNSSLRVIRELSKDLNIANRNITKEEFLRRIHNSKILFNEWFIEKKGEKLHFSNLRKEYFGDLNILHKDRFFLLDLRAGIYSRSETKEILNLIIKKYSKITNQPNPFCPYVYLHGINVAEIIEIKNDLIAEGTTICDGFDFEGSTFNSASILVKPNVAHQIKIKFLNNIDYLNQTLQIVGRKAEIYQFYINDEFFNYDNPSVKEVKIQIKEIMNIKSIV